MSGFEVMGGPSPAKNVYACFAKNDTRSISGNVIRSLAPRKCENALPL